jgi:hypothetical protein
MRFESLRARIGNGQFIRQEVRPMAQKNYFCRVCGKRFKTIKALNKHMKVHQKGAK